MSSVRKTSLTLALLCSQSLFCRPLGAQSLPLAASPAPSAAFDLKTTDGHVYKSARIARVEPDGITFFFAGGAVKITLQELPDDMKARFQLTPEKAAKFQQKEQAANEQAAEAVAAERTQLVESNIKARTHSIVEVESDLPDFIGRYVTIVGTIEIASAYVGGYRAAQSTHYAFRISDGQNSMLCYGSKDEFDNVRRQLLKAEDPLRGRFTLLLKPERFEKGQTVFTAEYLGTD